MTLQRRNGTLVGLTVAALTVAFFGPTWTSGPDLVAPAWSGDGKKTACFALPADEFSKKAAAVLGHLVRENFKREKKFDLVEVREMLNKGTRDPRDTAIAKARKLLADGKNQYDNLELDAALDALNQAREKFRKGVGRLGSGRDYIETLLFIGASHILSGDSELGADAFREVAMFDRRKTLDAKMFPPSMIEIFNAVKSQVGAAPVGMVQMKSNPPAAEVYLNGVYKGISPITLIKVPEGSHFVRVEKDGYQSWGQMVEFFATHEERVEATLKTSPGRAQFLTASKGLIGDLDDDEPKSELAKFGQWLGVERLVIVEVRQRAEEVTAEAILIQVEPPRKIAYRSATFELTSANFLTRADAFFTSMYRKVKIPPAAGVQKKEPGQKIGVASCNSDSDCATGEICDTASMRCIPYAPDKEQWYEKWWFWAIVGGGLAVGGAAGGLAWYFLQPEQGAIEFSF